MAGGMNALLDGYRGGLTYLDGRWQGYLNDLDCVVDMGEVTDIHKVSSRFMQLIGPGVYQPGEVELLTSEDGESYISQGVIPTTISNTDKDLSFQEYTFNGDWKARYIRMRNNSDQQMELYVLGFTATTKQDPQINEALMMYDMNLDTYKNLNPGEMIHIKCDDINAVSFFLSGSNENLVSITDLSQDGEKNIVYQGNVGYIKLNKTMFEDFSSLEITTIGKESIHIHQIVRE